MNALRHLKLATVPKVFLTATLDPNHEKVLAERVGISLDRTLVLRSPTARPNHLLQVAGLDSRTNDVFTTGLRLASLLLRKWEQDPSIRGVIFVRTTETVDSLSSSCPFPVCAYHSRMTDEKKGLQLHQWLSDESPAKWIIGTTGLLHGVDYPRVDAVIFLESPYGLYDFVQGAGRAGRSGQRSLITIIHQTPLPTTIRKTDDYPREEGMRTMIEASTCRRAAISGVMDGQSISCAQLADSVLCDACEGRLDPLITEAIGNSMLAPVTATALNKVVRRPPPTPLPTSLFSGKAAQVNSQSRLDHARKIKDLISRFSGCFSCRIVDPTHGPCHDSCSSKGVSACFISSHLPFSCGSLNHRLGWMQWKKDFVYPSDARRCYFCGLPESAFSIGEHKTNLPQKVRCRYSDAAMSAAWHVLNTPDLMGAVQRDFGFVPSSNPHHSFRAWLMEYGSESEEIRLLSVFSWLCKQYFPTAFM